MVTGSAGMPGVLGLWSCLYVPLNVCLSGSIGVSHSGQNRSR